MSNILHFAVDSGYTIQANVTSISVTVISNSTSGTVRIPFALTVDRNHFDGGVGGFLETPGSSGLIGLVFANSPGFTFSDGSTIVRHESLTGVQVVTDPALGTGYVVRDEVVHTYSLASPVSAPLEIPFVVSVLVQGPGLLIQESRPEFFRDSIEIILPGKHN